MQVIYAHRFGSFIVRVAIFLKIVRIWRRGAAGARVDVIGAVATLDLFAVAANRILPDLAKRNLREKVFICKKECVRLGNISASLAFPNNF